LSKTYEHNATKNAAGTLRHEEIQKADGIVDGSRSLHFQIGRTRREFYALPAMMLENIFVFCSPFSENFPYAWFRNNWRLLMDIQKELIAEFDREVVLTRKVLAAIPEDADFTWKPHPKSFSLGRLAGHVAETPGDWAIQTLTTDKLVWIPGQGEPFSPKSKAELLERFDKDSSTAREALAALDPAKWDENWKMVAGEQTWIDDTRYNVFRNWVLNHTVHHRAQLGMDLRLLGAKVPGVYGPSADEM
jgi:uncharacterized damage-inducible protein DinB